MNFGCSNYLGMQLRSLHSPGIKAKEAGVVPCEPVRRCRRTENIPVHKQHAQLAAIRLLVTTHSSPSRQTALSCYGHIAG